MNLPNQFKIYLRTQGVSSTTIKNYLSDFNHFFSWLQQVTGINHQIAGKSILGLFTQETLKEYQSHLVKENIPTTTINRRFSTLRKLGRFAQAQDWIKNNPAQQIKNIQPDTRFAGGHSPTSEVLVEFQKYLEEEKISPITIKNYLSDVRHFLNWLEAS